MDFPLDLRFKLLVISPQISVTDSAGRLLLYVKQQAFKLREAVTVYADEAQTRGLYRIEADRVLDFSAEYHITDAGGRHLGSLKQHGMRSLWRAHFDIIRDGRTILEIREVNPWTKVLDGLLGEIPVLGLLSGYLFHPAYRVSPVGREEAYLRAVKQPAFFEGVYRIERLGTLPPEELTLSVLCILMMLLLERRRG